jgi:hypothetical protein
MRNAECGRIKLNAEGGKDGRGAFGRWRFEVGGKKI